MFRRLLWIVIIGCTAWGERVTAANESPCTTARTYRDHATVSYRKHDLIATISQLRKAAQLCPTEPFPMFMLANALYRAAALEESANAYEAFLHLRPNHFEAHMSLGFALFELGDKKKAIEQWTIAANVEPESPFARAALAVGFYSIGDADNALIQYERAIAIAPRYEQPEALAIDIRWKPAVRAMLSDVKGLTNSKGEN
jgi:tetratricopeptide (TPR) repeat protein